MSWTLLLQLMILLVFLAMLINLVIVNIVDNYFMSRNWPKNRTSTTRKKNQS